MVKTSPPGAPTSVTGECSKRREHWAVTLRVCYTAVKRLCLDTALSLVGKVFSGDELSLKMFSSFRVFMELKEQDGKHQVQASPIPGR